MIFIFQSFQHEYSISHIHVFKFENSDIFELMIIQNVLFNHLNLLKTHKRRASLAVCTRGGTCELWENDLRTRNWSAFAPNFTELFENELYVEREDEFDQSLIQPTTNTNRNKRIPVDILSRVKDVPTFSSDDFEDHYRPLVPAQPLLQAHGLKKQKHHH